MTEVLKSTSEAASRLGKSVVAIGNFDGMHIGHQAIFDRAHREALARDATVVALTFEPHPVAFFRPDKAPSRLCPPPYKYDVIADRGAQVVVALPFNEDLAGHSPAAFVESILVDSLKAEHVVVGRDFRFGKKRAGDTESLKTLGAEFGMTRSVVDFVRWDDDPVSSTRIREAVGEGQMEAARAMLGRPYRLYGQVVHGDERGRKLGFPTANMEVMEMALPPAGVYATTLGRNGQSHWSAITNIGQRPTFGAGAMTVETFVLDDAAGDELDLYGDDVELDLYYRVRGERKFDSPKALVSQIERDCDEVRQFFEDEGFHGRR